MFIENDQYRPNISGSDDLRRALKPRHVLLIALGGIIGSCYFLGTGAAVAQVGPGAFLAYILGGIIIYLTMMCMGELAVAIPNSGSFINYAARFISPSFACGSGWSYWINWVVYIPAECLAAGIIMHMFTGFSGYLWAVCFGLLITYINISSVHIFGEIEFWLALVKIIALVGFVILALLIFTGMIHNQNNPHFIGTQYLLGHHGLFPFGAWSLLTAMVLLLVNYQGAEIIGLAAAESNHSHTMMPKMIRLVVLRILGLYIVPVFCLVLIFPWQKAGLSNSVFADALSRYGLHWAGAFLSFVTLTAAISCANSGFYAAVRALRALAHEGMAPRYFTQLNKNAVPQRAVILTILSIWITLGAGFFFSESTMYMALLLVSGFTGTVCWISICWSQINFRKAYLKAGYKIEDLHYRTPLYPYTGIIGIVLMVGCLLFLFASNNLTNRIAFVIGVLNIIVPMVIYKWVRKRRGLQPEVG